MTLIDLSGHRALVTGAGHGIGAEIAETLAVAGADVVVHYGSSAADAAETVTAIEAAGRKSIAIQADVTVPEQVRHLVAESVAFLGGLTVLVANAGAVVTRSPVAELTPQLWRQIIDVNATSTFLTCQAAIPALVDSRGSIVTLGSVSAYNGGGPGAVAYATAKAAVAGFTRGLARELAPSGVRVNAVAPGFIANTRFHAATPPAAVAAITAGIPIGRAGRSSDVAGVVAFLASPLAAFVTGETVDITGGQWTR